MATPTLATAGGRNLAVGYAGQIADLEPAQVSSYINNSATAIDFGVLVVRDTTVDGTCKPMAADTDQQLGISVRNAVGINASSANVVNYAQYASVPVMNDGVVFVTAAEAVRAGDAVLALTAGPGTFASSKGGVAGSGRVAVTGAIWLDTVAASGIGRIRIKTAGNLGRTTT